MPLLVKFKSVLEFWDPVQNLYGIIINLCLSHYSKEKTIRRMRMVALVKEFLLVFWENVRGFNAFVPHVVTTNIIMLKIMKSVQLI